MHIGSLLGALSPLFTGETPFGHMALIEPSLALPGPALAPLEGQASSRLPPRAEPADPDFSNPARQEGRSQRNDGHNPTAKVGIAVAPTRHELEHSPVVYGAEVSGSRGESLAGTLPGAWTQFEARQVGSGNLFADFFVNQAEGQSSVSIEQIGVDNRISGSQASGRSSVFIAQIGDLHTATITQSGRSNDLVLVQQISTNRAVMLQAGTDGALTLAQEGRGNKASILQLGDHNVGKIQQLGSENLVLVRQSGEAGTISVSQKGLGQFAEIIQAGGSRNSASVVQNSDFSAAVISQSGSSNYAQIIQ